MSLSVVDELPYFLQLAAAVEFAAMSLVGFPAAGLVFSELLDFQRFAVWLLLVKRY